MSTSTMQEYASSSSSSSSPSHSRSCYTSSSLAVARTFRRFERRMGGNRGINILQPSSRRRQGSALNIHATTPLLGDPQTPSPFCSYASTITTTTATRNTAPLIGPRHFKHSPHSLYATEFSSPRKQLASECAESERSCYNNECSNMNNYFSDIDEWLEHANKFCKANSELYTVGDCTKEDIEEEEDDDDMMRISVICKDFLSAPENELHNIALPSIREESPVNQTHLSSCIYHPPPFKSDERARLLTRREYGLTNKHQLEKRARNKAKHAQIMQTLRRKEEAINNWELQQTRKAMDHMDKIQNKLEKKQLVASAKTQKKICSVREKAEKQKLNLRRSTMKKFQQLQLSENQKRTQTERSWGLC